MTAPRMVDGSMTNMRSQSIRGLGLKEWRRLMLKKRLATAPPTMVKLERATAYFAGKPAKKGEGLTSDRFCSTTSLLVLLLYATVTAEGFCRYHWQCSKDLKVAVLATSLPSAKHSMQTT